MLTNVFLYGLFLCVLRYDYHPIQVTRILGGFQDSHINRHI